MANDPHRGECPFEDLTGMVCPRPIAEIVQAVHTLTPGERIRFRVDDPLVLSAVPEELEEFEDMVVEITEEERGWMIVVSRRPLAKEDDATASAA